MAKVNKDKYTVDDILITKEEQPYSIPDNWCWIRPQAVLSIEYGKGLPTKKLTEDGYPVFGANGQIGCYSEYMFEEEMALMSCRGAYSGTMNISLPFSYVTSNSLVMKNKGCYFSPKFIFYMFEALDTRKLVSGSAQPQVTVQAFNNFAIPVPPINEQIRIVETVERLFDKLDDAKNKAQEAMSSSDIRINAILHDAFSGKLTKAWRNKQEEMPCNYVDIARKERDSIIGERKLKPLKYSFPDDITLFEIPNNWQFSQIGDVAWSIKDGPHYSPEYVDEGIPFITGGNVRPNGVDFESAKRITPELHEELCKRCKPELNDMLYTKGGTTGIAKVNTYDFDFSVWVHVAVIKYVSTLVPEYFQYVLNSPFCYEQSQKYTHGVGNQDLGLTRMINIIFPICSVGEQREIVRILDDFYLKENKIRESLELVIEQIEMIKESILAKAFRGELGTNIADEESPIELLKQIINI